MSTAVAAAPTSGRTWFGHPRGLFILFLTEMWERFSYYGMRSLLVLYMVKYLFIQPEVGQRLMGFTALKTSLEVVFGPLAAQPLSSQIYGLYTAFVYLTPFFGGMLADRIIGQRRAVILGAVLMAIGHFLMASEHLFLPALIFLVLGNGAFKPNISTQVGSLYPEGDPRRDRAFTIFYMGINLGATFSPLVCGTLGQSSLGWHWGFAAAGVGMVLGLIIYLYGQRIIGRPASEIVAGLIALLIGLPTLIGLMPVNARVPVVSVAALVGIGWLIRSIVTLPREERPPVLALITLCAPIILFWGCYEQQGNTVQLWADTYGNWPKIFGWTMKSTWLQAFNPAMIFIFAPLLNVFWAWQSKNGKEPSSVVKMAMGCVMMGLSYIVMALASQGLAPDARRSVMWLVGFTVVITIGELYLSPIGLSLVTKVAPTRLVSRMMGIWFLSNFFGNYLTGYLGTYWEKMPKDTFFWLLVGLGVGAGVVIFLFAKPVNNIVRHHDRPQSPAAAAGTSAAAAAAAAAAASSAS